MSAVEMSKETYGSAAFQLFYLLMEETDKETFDHMVEVLRSTLKSYGQSKLLDYLDREYLRQDRVKQWAKWYRISMYNCKWILDTNMHVESWHNFLKSVLMDRYKNVRVDKLLRILVQAEVVYRWKWSRTRLGCLKRFDPAWLEMHGHVSIVDSVPDPTAGITYFEHIYNKFRNVLEFFSSDTTTGTAPAPTRKEVKRTSYTKDILRVVTEVQSLLRTKLLPVDRQKAILRQLTGVMNVLKHESGYGTHVVTVPEGFTKTEEAKCKVIPRVVTQYQFKRKCGRKQIVKTNVSAFRSSEMNRHNHFQSFQMACGVNTEMTTATQLKSLTVTLRVKQSRSKVTLGGITLNPSIGGIVIALEHGVEALHVQVMKVHYNLKNI